MQRTHARRSALPYVPRESALRARLYSAHDDYLATRDARDIALRAHDDASARLRHAENLLDTIEANIHAPCASNARKVERVAMILAQRD